MMMSTKRTSTKSSHDEQTTKDSGGEFMQAVIQNEEDNTKRAKLISLSDATLQDLPMELLECILVKAVAMEVKGMKPAKSKRKEKADLSDLVIDRLRTVSLKWNSVLSTDFFRNELNRTMDGFAKDTLRWEVVLHQPPIQSYITSLATMRDEVFALVMQHGGSYELNVYDRNNVAQSKDGIPIPEFNLGNMAACSVSNCVYLLNNDRRGLSIMRIGKDEHDQFKVSVWMKHMRMPRPLGVYGCTGLSVSAKGNLIVISKQHSPTPTVVGIYDANGVVQQMIRLSPETYGFKAVSCAIQKADGNLLLTCSHNISETKFLEIDTSGSILRQHQSSHIGAGVRSFEDIYGRILVNSGYKIELFESDLNLLDGAVPQLDDGQELHLFYLHYNSDRHEMMGLRHDWNSRRRTDSCVLATIRFTDE